MEHLEIPLGKRTRLYRFFEMLPGILSYTMIALPVILSMIDPFLGAVFVIVYIIVWFVKSMAMTVRSVQGYNISQRAQHIDWRSRLNDLESPETSLKNRQRDRSWRSEVHRHNLNRLAATEGVKKPSDIYHAVIIATYNESIEVLTPTIQSILESDYDHKRLFITIAYEERGGEDIEKTVRALQATYGDRFGDFSLVKHPKDLPNEIVGKGANITYAGFTLQKQIEKKGIAPENVIVTTLDSDNRPHKTYFSYVAYEFLVHPEPRYVSFQPLSLFLNNIWDVPAPMRVIATNNSFWNIVVSQRPHMLRNFASHSQPLAALIDMEFWSKHTIVEDGHQFWRSYFRYDGHYGVVPIYVPIYQDAVMTDTYRSTLKAQFIQLRRWAYGASDIPYVALQVFRYRTAPFADSFVKFLRLLDGHVSWANTSFILLLGAFAPLFLNANASRSIVAHQLPNIASGLQQIAMIGLVIMVAISFRMLPKRPARYKWTRSAMMLLQWVLAPFLGIIYGSLAALNAQTHLLFGKYLDRFDVTEKSVVKHKT